MPLDNHKFICEMVRQSQQQQFVDEDKSTANRNRAKKMWMDWSHAEKTLIYHHQTSPAMESTREEEKRTDKKHLAVGHRVESEKD